MNINVIQKLPQSAQSKGTYAVLARLDGKAVWEFVVMPTNITFEKSINNSAVRTQSGLPFVQYNGSDNQVLAINNLPLSTIGINKSLTAYVEAFENLAAPDASAFSPPALLFRWNQRIFSPCILDGRISRKETFWSPTGDLLQCNLGFQLVKVPDEQLINL